MKVGDKVKVKSEVTIEAMKEIGIWYMAECVTAQTHTVDDIVTYPDKSVWAELDSGWSILVNMLYVVEEA